ncbi:MAG: cobyrinate a,c-diamide synthase, partial [Candidatus Tectomicrobia bacterium]|nr:cobyrinate a,c-diamide synthase [Candidatus Tectomicrobia bacterium]
MTMHAIPRLVIAAPHSHSGKTTVTLALLAALTQRGLRVAPFKVGPDYIDPQMHRQAVGRPCYNVDTYLVPPERVRDTFCRVAQHADLAIIEGVMGLFDGSGPTSRVGSTAEVATLLQAPVVLVIDAAGMAASVGALVRGFRTYDPAVQVAGVILNRLGSAGHARYLEPAITREGVTVLGALPKDASITIPERHLGLLPTSEDDRVTPLLAYLTALAERHVHLDRVLALARTAPPLPPCPAVESPPVSPTVRVAWAQDAAFHFAYQENMDALRAAGAAIVPFSPLQDTSLPPDIDAVWLGGGFPEHFAAQLAANTGMHRALQTHAARGLPLYAECGGLMYLCEWLEDQHGQRYPQVGLIPGGTRMTTRLQQFGYAEATFLQDTLLGPAGTTVRGHRFHYSV